MGLKEGDPDPHWQIVARSDDPDFKPQPAVVTSYDDRYFLANDPARSQWISTANGSPELPNGVTYTFRTTFELERVVRADGFPARLVHCRQPRDCHPPERQDVAGARAGDNSFAQPHEFSIRNGFVEGTNVLEFDVYNGIASDPELNRKTSPMSLRVELEGSYFGGHDSAAAKEEPRRTPRKGGCRHELTRPPIDGTGEAMSARRHDGPEAGAKSLGRTGEFAEASRSIRPECFRRPGTLRDLLFPLSGRRTAMCFKSNLIVLVVGSLTLAAALFSATPATATVILYQDNFDRGTVAPVALNGTTPDTTSGLYGAPPAPPGPPIRSDDQRDAGRHHAYGARTPTARAMYLPFTPQTGHVYTFSATVQCTLRDDSTRRLAWRWVRLRRSTRTAASDVLRQLNS